MSRGIYRSCFSSFQTAKVATAHIDAERCDESRSKYPGILFELEFEHASKHAAAAAGFAPQATEVQEQVRSEPTNEAECLQSFQPQPSFLPQ